MFERLTFQVFDTPDLKVTVYTPLEEADTPRKVEQLLELWYQQEGQEPHTPEAVHSLPQAQLSRQDTVGLWLAECGQRVERAWVANSDIMNSYANWCVRNGYEPKKAKGVSQSLAAHGFEIGVNKRVVDEDRRRKMARGVRGLAML